MPFWFIFLYLQNPNFKKMKTVTIKHKSNLHYLELDPFEKELKEKGLAAHREKSINQDYLKGKTFEQKLKILGW